MIEPFKDENKAAKAFERWRELFTKARNQGLSRDEQREIRRLSRLLGDWFKP